ncbi:MAG: 6-carboxytetrahydropterin synthase QueD [Candidatus Acididesulfobacter diazotrophicus]|jgi:6-pyruvoyltetrahydropterin/6-carboxytetrahydropterin synthase|uniref:6-carboxy-5,6,7,8-tetrahydropterin synthase n=1 Tax=Candidatus Acididesulfobacter diazotrophicus TaxID=2597226 RepID=A0A519BQI5_9DELT|nr:MAG: 6-carboxytetrahydropterin synthase QueD [Candidatus Acididesulfobacter diazotrophicus]
MYELKILSVFSSAHNLRGYNGKCENIHGHNWQIEVIVCSELLNEIGIAIDFKILKSYLKIIMEKLDHKYINELPYFENINPSAENIAKYIFEEFGILLNNNQESKSINIKVKKVNVYETATSMASYFE